MDLKTGKGIPMLSYWHMAVLPLILYLVLAVSDPVYPQDSIQLLDQSVHSLVNEGFRGTLLIAGPDRVMLNRSYGMAHDSPDIAYAIGSMSESFTATAIFKLAEEHRLRLSDSISRFLKFVPPDKQHIRIIDLLTHTAGLPDDRVADGISSQEDASFRILQLKINASFTGKYFHSTDGYNLLAIIVERIMNMPFEKFIQNEIFDLAGMHQSGFWGLENLLSVPLAGIASSNEHSDIPGVYESGKCIRNYGWKGAKGIYSTTGDLQKFLQALYSRTLLRNTGLNKMWAPLVFIASPKLGTSLYAAAGWYILYKDGKKVWARQSGKEAVMGHSGLMYLKDDGWVYILLSDSGNMESNDDLTAKILLAINKYFPGF